jgi:NADH-quinone oxidoreductase subunit I
MKGLFKGLKVTFEHIFRPAFTVAYPYQKIKLSPRMRGRHGFRMDSATGQPLCIGCQQCVKICPDRLIVVKTSKAPEGSPKKLNIDEVTVDIAPCMFCGLCEDICPVDAIVLTPFYEMATQDKSTLMMNKEKLIESAKDYEPPE